MGNSNSSSGNKDEKLRAGTKEGQKLMEGTEKKKRNPAKKSKRSCLTCWKQQDNEDEYLPESDNEIIRARPKEDNSTRLKSYNSQSINLQDNDIKKVNAKLDEINKMLSQEITKLNERMLILDQRLKKIEDELFKNQFRKPEKVDSDFKKIGVIQILQRGEGDFLYIIVKYLRDVLCNETYQPEIKTYKRPSDVNESGPLLVVCISSTRVVEDAENAIKDVQELERTLLLIFHMKEKHVLPVTNSKPQLSGQSFNNLGGVLDFAFTSELGVYSCEMNDHSKTNMIQIIENISADCTRMQKSVLITKL